MLLEAKDLHASYEEAWARLREIYGPGEMPRTVNMISGPSRTADIEQTIVRPAHGPKDMHVIIVRERLMWKPVDEIVGALASGRGRGARASPILRQHRKAISVRSRVIGENDGSAFAFSYEIDLDKTGGCSAFAHRLRRRAQAVLPFAVQPGAGGWTPVVRRSPSSMAAIDIDLSFTASPTACRSGASASPRARRANSRCCGCHPTRSILSSTASAILVSSPDKRFHYEATDGCLRRRDRCSTTTAS